MVFSNLMLIWVSYCVNNYHMVAVVIVIYDNYHSVILKFHVYMELNFLRLRFLPSLASHMKATGDGLSSTSDLYNRLLL